jgi:hypothetical protein
MNPYHPTYVPVIAHIQDLEHEAAAARLAALAACRRPLRALIHSTVLRLRSIQTQVFRPQPEGRRLAVSALKRSTYNSSSGK